MVQRVLTMPTVYFSSPLDVYSCFDVLTAFSSVLLDVHSCCDILTVFSSLLLDVYSCFDILTVCFSLLLDVDTCSHTFALLPAMHRLGLLTMPSATALEQWDEQA